MKPVKTWILLANNKTARILENVGPGKGIHQLPDHTYNCLPETQTQSDQGRTFNSIGTIRHKMEHHHGDAASVNEFANDLVGQLSKYHQEQKFDRLIISAAPAMLADLRKILPATLKRDIVTELAKDLTNIPTNQLDAHFDDVLAV